MSDVPVALVTGGSSGIGRAVAQRLAGQGYRLVLVARHVRGLEEVASELETETAVASADVGELEEAGKIMDMVRDRFGRLDVLVNNAGMAHLKTLKDATLDEWHEMLSVNASSVFAMTKAAWPLFADQKAGMVVNISSMAAKDPFPGLGLYGACKAAVNLLTLVTAREGKSIGLKAVCIAPGAVETPLLRSMFSEKQVPASAALDPDEVAEVVHHCVTGEREFERGETIYVSK